MGKVESILYSAYQRKHLWLAGGHAEARAGGIEIPVLADYSTVPLQPTGHETVTRTAML